MNGHDDDDDREQRTDFRTQRVDDHGLLRIVGFWDGGSVTRILPLEGTFSIGRSTSCDIRIDHASVSRRHAILHLGATVRVEDASSANGTRVGGRELTSGVPVPLTPGDVLEIGSVVLVLQGGAQDAARPPAAPAPALTPRRAVKFATMSTVAPQNVRANESPAQRLERLVKLVAAGNIQVLIQGETGTGKQETAERVHAASRRAGAPLVSVDGSRPVDLLEREMFGEGDEPGAFEQADGGTLVIDEVSELPPLIQMKLARVLERSEVLRGFATEAKKIDVRCIGTTSRDLRALVAEGTFREDLYFRLNGITIEVPPLRERREQIATLAGELLASACAVAGRPALTLTTEVRARLESYRWPGNIRELKNVIERAVLLSPGNTLDASTLPDAGPDELLAAPLRGDLAAFERQRIIEALDKCAGNQTKAAELLGLSRRTLVTRISEYNLPRPRGGNRR